MFHVKRPAFVLSATGITFRSAGLFAGAACLSTLLGLPHEVANLAGE
jgi:hypothetical protein